MITVLIVRSFETSPPGRVTRQRFMLALELPAVPVPGHRVTVPGGPGPLVVERVVLHARPTTGWTPGFTPAAVEVELAPEPDDGLDAALARGWQPVASTSPLTGSADHATSSPAGRHVAVIGAR